MRFAAGAIAALIFSAMAAAQGSINWSVLPNARTGAPNEDLTFLATIVNGRDVTMTCQPRFGGFFTLSGGASGQARFFTYDNGVVGDTANGIVAIPANGRQDYVVVLSVNRAYRGNVIVNIQCTDPNNLPTNLRRIAQVNDFQVVIESGNPPDIIMIGSTLSNDGVARIEETGPRAALMTIAAVNIGGTATDFIVIPDATGYSTLHNGYQPTICETDASGICLGPEEAFVRIASWPTNEVRLFAVRMRVPPQLGVPFYPDYLRLRVRAGPEAAATGLDGPANQWGDLGRLLDVMFGGYGNGVTARPDRDPRDNFLRFPVQQCATQPNGDTGDDWRRSGGILAITPADTGGTMAAVGYLEFSDISADVTASHIIPVSVEAPANGGSGTVTLHGSGSGTPVPNDVTYPIEAAPPGTTGNLIFTWEPQPGGFLDFRQAGSARCAPAPANSIVASRPRAARESAFGGTSSASPAVAGFADIVADGGNVAGAGGTPVILQNMQPHTPPLSGLTQEQIALVYDASMTVFRQTAQVGYEAVFAPSSWRIRDNNPDINCGVLGYTGTAITSGQVRANDDAGVSTLTGTDDDPDELGDGECVQ